MRLINYIICLFFIFYCSITRAEEVKKFETADSILVKQILAEANNIESAKDQIDKYTEAYIYSQNIGYINGINNSLIGLIIAHEKLSQRVESIRYCLNFITLNEKFHFNNINFVLNKTADLLAKENIPSMAKEYYFKSFENTGEITSLKKSIEMAIAANDEKYAIGKLQIFSKKQLDVESKIYSYKNLAWCYLQTKDNINAIDNFKNLFAIANTTGDKALAANNLGYLESNKNNFIGAENYFLEALKITKDANELSKIYQNLSVVTQNLNKQNQAINYLDKAITLNSDCKLKSNAFELLSKLYLLKNDLFNSIRYADLGISEAIKCNNKSALSNLNLNKALCYQKSYDFENAFIYYKQHLIINDQLLNESLSNARNQQDKQGFLQQIENEQKENILNAKIQQLTFNTLKLEKDKLQLEKDRLNLLAEKKEAEISNLRRDAELKTQQLRNIELQNIQNQQKLKIAAEQQRAIAMNNKIALLAKQEEFTRLELAQKEGLEKTRLQQINILEQSKKIDKLEIEKQKNVKRNILYSALILGSLALIAAFSFINARRKNKLLHLKNTEIENKNVEIENNRNLIELEKHKSDGLLLNILPSQIADELKEVGEAKPTEYEMVSVLFSDFVNFTTYAERTTTDVLIAELNEVFLLFDEIADKHNLEKIKTIGDSYMCAGGLPTPNKTNALDAVLAAKEMIHALKKYNANRTAENQFNVRIGINTGKVVAGVIGKRKFAYDIWGDTVNTAARMEQSGETGKINISENTYLLIKNSINCTYRGLLPAKNKGEIKMYFVD